MDDLEAELEAIQAGDADAFGRWLAGAEPRLRAALASFATYVDVEVVVQEALLRAWQVASRVRRDGAPNALLRLCVRMARNLAIDEARRARLEPDSLPEEEALQALAARSEPQADVFVLDAVRECRDQLPEKPAAALAQRLDEGGARSDRELAARLGMQTNTFLKNFGRARKALADCLRRRGIELGTALGGESA